MDKSILREEKPIFRMRILAEMKALKKSNFDPIVQQLLSNEKRDKKKKLKLKRTDFKSIEEYLFNYEVSFDFKLNFYTIIEEMWLKLEGEYSKKKKQFMFEILGEGIVKWIEELESIEDKISPERRKEYDLFHQELWDLYKIALPPKPVVNKKIKPPGRPGSKYKEFKDCLNLNADEYKKFEFALSQFIKNGVWVSIDETDYPSLLVAITRLKFTKKFQKDPFAKAFCRTYNVELRKLGYRRKENTDTRNLFLNLLKDIRPTPLK